MNEQEPLEQDHPEQASLQDNEQASNANEYDYNREPPLDSATLRQNRRSSKYVFMTLCFLLALVMLYIHLTGTFASADGSTDWFPLVAAVVLAIMGVVFLRSSDGPPGKGTSTIDPAQQTRPSATEPATTEDMPLSAFELLVQEALATIPAEFQAQMENVAVHVVPQPEAEVLQRLNVQSGSTLLGLYEGVPLTAYGHQQSSYPEIITIYQQTIEAYCQHDPARIREQVRSTVLHEVAHHFGMGHEEMPIWIK